MWWKFPLGPSSLERVLSWKMLCVVWCNVENTVSWDVLTALTVWFVDFLALMQWLQWSFNVFLTLKNWTRYCDSFTSTIKQQNVFLHFLSLRGTNADADSIWTPSYKNYILVFLSCFYTTLKISHNLNFKRNAAVHTSKYIPAGFCNVWIFITLEATVNPDPSSHVSFVSEYVCGSPQQKCQRE